MLENYALNMERKRGRDRGQLIEQSVSLHFEQNTELVLVTIDF